MNNYSKHLEKNIKNSCFFVLLGGLVWIGFALVDAAFVLEENNYKTTNLKLKDFNSPIDFLILGIIFIVSSILLYIYEKKHISKDTRLSKMTYIIDHGEVIYEDSFIKIVDSILIDMTNVRHIVYLDEIYSIKEDTTVSFHGESHTVVNIWYKRMDNGDVSNFAINIGYVPIELAKKLSDIIKNYCPRFNGDVVKFVNDNYKKNSYEEAFKDNHYIPNERVRQNTFKDIFMIEKKAKAIKVSKIKLLKSSMGTIWMQLLLIVEIGGILLVIDMFQKKDYSIPNLIIYPSMIIIPIIILIITCHFTAKKIKDTKY